MGVNSSITNITKGMITMSWQPNSDIEYVTKLNSPALSSIKFMPSKISSLNKKDMVKTETILEADDGYVKFIVNNSSVKNLIPIITDIKTYNNNTIKVFFDDGTVETATVSGGDKFNFEQGVTICLFKKVLSRITYEGCGSSAYNKLIKYATKVSRDLEAEKEKEFDEYLRIQRCKTKAKEKRKRREERLARQRKEEEIEIQKEAYIRAMKELNSNAPGNTIEKEGV